MKKERHLTKFCNHPGSLEVMNGKASASAWCKYCRLRAFGGVKYKELKAIYERDQTKLIQVKGYPCDFEFEVVGPLPGFSTKKMCAVRNEFLYQAMTKMRVKSPCPAYGEYTVELVTKTPTGEVWQLGS